MCYHRLTLTLIILIVFLTRSAEPTRCQFSADSQLLTSVGARRETVRVRRGEESDNISFQEHYHCPGQEDPAEATSCCSPGCCSSSSSISHRNLIIVISLAIIDLTLALVLIICCCCQKCPLYENINFSSLMRKPRFQSRIKYSKTETRILKY